MSNLEQQVEQSATALQQAWTGLQKVPTSASLPRKCYDQWQRRADLHQQLTGTISIFPARDAAWKVVQSVAQAQRVGGKDNVVAYGSVEVDFGIARHLALASYVSVAWSAYDRLANVCGRIAGVNDLALNPQQNPKVFEDFLGDKDRLGFASQLHIRDAYGWPVRVSYRCRNWLIHEGYEIGGTPLFEGNRIQDGFILDPKAVELLQKTCGHTNENGKIGFCCVAAGDTSWDSRDLMRILELYHGEIDTMFVALLKWSVDSFLGQIKAFVARDQA